MTNVLIVGGGQRVEKIRELQQVRGWNDQHAHWLSIQAMEQTAELVRRRLVGQGHAVKMVDSLTQRHDRPSTLSIFSVQNFLRHVDARQEERLPEDWTVTSDSIAARLAVMTEAAELVLLKSALPPSGASLADLSEAGFVDAHFPLAARTLLVRMVNAREIDWPEMPPICPELPASGIPESCRRSRRH
jgi:dihydroneopterin aldolase